MKDRNTMLAFIQEHATGHELYSIHIDIEVRMAKQDRKKTIDAFGITECPQCNSSEYIIFLKGDDEGSLFPKRVWHNKLCCTECFYQEDL